MRTIPSWSLRVSGHAVPLRRLTAELGAIDPDAMHHDDSFLATATTARRRSFRRIRRRPQLLIPNFATASIIMALAAG